MIEMEWALPTSPSSGTCGDGNEGSTFALACPGSTISAVEFASYGTPTGDCASGFKQGKCASNTTLPWATKCCAGKASCTVSCGGQSCSCDGQATTIPDPCFNTPKIFAIQVACAGKPSPAGPTLNLRVAVPAGTDAQLVVPLLGSAAKAVTITENSTVVFKDGAYVAGVAGITGATVVGYNVVVEHGSGAYSFVRSG